MKLIGDYWHANPAIYKSTDLIHYRKGKKYAIDVWAKDQKKRKIANESGYVVLELWEQDLSQMSDEEILQIIYEFIRRICDDVDETKEN